MYYIEVVTPALGIIRNKLGSFRLHLKVAVQVLQQPSSLLDVSYLGCLHKLRLYTSSAKR